MAATERLVILLTLKQKQQLAGLAKQAGLSVSEYVRTRVLEDPELDDLVEQINSVADTAIESLDRLAGRVSDLEQAEREARARAGEEFSEIDPERFASLVQPVEAVA